MEKLLWTRRGFIKGVAAFAGAGMLQPVLPLIGGGKSFAAAYPEEVLSIEKYTKGKVKPGMIITAENADLIKDIANEGLMMELKLGGRIKITDTTLNPDAVNYHGWNEATLRNKGQAMFDKKGMLIHKNGGPWIGGAPFPEPKTGIEAVWNHRFNPRRYDDLTAVHSHNIIDRQGREIRRENTIYHQINTVGRLSVDPPVMPRYKDELGRSVLTYVDPFDVRGTSILTTIFYDGTKLPDTDLYIPALKRTRRVPSTQRFEPIGPMDPAYITDIDIQNDPVNTWSWKLVGSKPMLGPSPSNLGARFKNATKDDFIFPLVTPPLGFPPSSWELRPEMFMVDGVPTSYPGAPYKVKRMFIDGIYQRCQLADVWDLGGKLWKTLIFITGFVGAKDKKGNEYCEETGIVISDLQKAVHLVVHCFDERYGVKMAMDKGQTIDDWYTPAALMKNAMK